MNFTKELRAATQPRVDLAKLLKGRTISVKGARGEHSEAASLIKALHSTGGVPLRKFEANEQQTAPAAAAATPIATPWPIMDDGSRGPVALYERLEREAAVESIGEALRRPGTSLIPAWVL